MLKENSEMMNSKWNNFIKEEGKGSEFSEIIESIKELEKNHKSSSLEKVLYFMKEKRFSKNKDSFDIIWTKLQDESKKTNMEELNWWDKFFIDRGLDIKIRNILEEIEKADRTGEEKDITKAITSISKLNKEVYEYDINILNKRVRILEKRIDRRVSDSFGYILASIREQKGLSLAKLGDMAGVSASYINRIELNQRKAPSYPIIEKLADALDVNVNTLLVAAGANLEESKTKSLRELIFSNNISLKENEKALNSEKKEKLIKIIDYISEMGWDENKHIESLQLFELITEYKS